jgi:AcrR family transcriptional regulator
VKIKTKELIKNKALELFNEKGSHRITTNHIADAMGISPGNLYYHYGNKEEIIRDLFAEATAAFQKLWDVLTDVSAAEMLSLFRESARVYYAYRFFYMEMPMLISRDPELAAVYSANHARNLEVYTRIAQSVMNRDRVNKMTEAEIRAIVVNGWIVSEFWLSYLFLSGTGISEETVARYSSQMLLMICPYLDEKTRMELGTLTSGCGE